MKVGAVKRITGRVSGATSVFSVGHPIIRRISASVVGNGRKVWKPVHSEITLCKCSTCGRSGVMRENGIPANWRLQHQDQLLCPVCWGPNPSEFDPLAERKMVPSKWTDV